jgi:hypothetical protein
MRRLPGPADRPLCEGVKTPEAPVELFRGWQRTQTQSSVRALRSLRQQMDVWFCLEQEPKAERHCCVTADPDQTNCAPSGARPGILCFSLDFDLHRRGRSGKLLDQHTLQRVGTARWRPSLIGPRGLGEVSSPLRVTGDGPVKEVQEGEERSPSRGGSRWSQRGESTLFNRP